MDAILTNLVEAVEFGKVDKNSPYPPNMKGQDGADELARQALDKGVISYQRPDRCTGSGHGQGGPKVF